MFKKIGKVIGFIAVAAAAAAGAVAVYKKCTKSDEDFDEFDDFDDDDFDDDFSDMDIENRGYTSISPDAAKDEAEKKVNTSDEAKKAESTDAKN